MASTFVSKSRRVRFELTLRIIDLNNVPLVSGTSFIKWHLPSSTAAEHRGKTQKCAIKDHRVQYGYEKQTQVRLIVGKDQMLQECRIDLECLQEYSAGGRGERIVLGHVHLNLAEYVEAPEMPSPGGLSPDTHEGITRRYLMQDSKINSTLKLGITMRHIEGTKDYLAPALKTAPVFGGIAGIISSSEAASTPHGVASHVNGEHAEGSQQEIPMPNFSSSNKEIGEMQDMYRRTLAAFWASQQGELKADECIEDIFAGGDGWGKGGRPVSRDDNFARASPNTTPNPEADATPKGSSHHSTVRHMNQYHNFMRHGKTRKSRGELEEIDVREDLVSWQVGERAYA